MPSPPRHTSVVLGEDLDLSEGCAVAAAAVSRISVPFVCFFRGCYTNDGCGRGLGFEAHCWLRGTYSFMPLRKVEELHFRESTRLAGFANSEHKTYHGSRFDIITGALELTALVTKMKDSPSMKQFSIIPDAATLVVLLKLEDPLSPRYKTAPYSSCSRRTRRAVRISGDSLRHLCL